MKRVSYDIEDMRVVAGMLNEVSVRGVTLEQARYLSAAAGIIDGKNFGIEEMPDTDAAVEGGDG